MSDLGDSFRERRNDRRRERQHWYACDGCGVWSDNPVKVPPGGKCHRCGWQAPEVEKNPRARYKGKKA